MKPAEGSSVGSGVRSWLQDAVLQSICIKCTCFCPTEDRSLCQALTKLNAKYEAIVLLLLMG